MEATSVFTSPSSSSHSPPTLTSSASPQNLHPSLSFIFSRNSRCLSRYPRLFSSLRTGGIRYVLVLPPRALVIDDEVVEKPGAEGDESRMRSSSGSLLRKGRDGLPKVDKTGRFCSPRAARELALTILYGSCIEGSDPVRLFEKRLNEKREAGFEFDKAYLSEYNPMRFGGPPVTVETTEEADRLQQLDDKESLIEAEVLAAPPKLIYNKLMLRFTRKLLVAVVEKWDSHALIIDKIVPANWKLEAAGKILELCILRLAMSEIAVVGTQHQIVVNEAVDLAKQFCDGAAPRVINGCLRTFVRDTKGGE